MDTNKMREQFEAWISSYIGSTWLGRNDHQMDEYIDENAQFMWEAWQASREAVVVELPEVQSDMIDQVGGEQEVRYYPQMALITAIEAQRLKVAS
ncbi:MAG: hypothetical protein ACN6P2_09680 [Pseudomonas palmensis]|uniref:hypothetical protein n=1 Tax=Pseudomonas palmensis TaxID=2815362 RepID=UPI003D0FE185